MSQANGVSRKSCRVLIKEIYKNDREKVEKLLIRGANVNGADYDGNTPLHHAVASRDVGIMRLIIEHGGDVNAENNVRFRPYDVALEENFIEALELLLKNNAEITNIDEAVSKLPRHIVDLIYEKIGLEERNAQGYTMLHIAIANNDVSAVHRLLSRGVDITAKSVYRGESPLHLVISHEIAELLLDLGVSINTPDRYACTPLSAVAVKTQTKLTRNEQSRIIELFLDRGAEVLDVLVTAELHLDYNGDFYGMHGLKEVLKFMGLREDEQSYRKRIYRGEFSVFYRQVLAEVAKMKMATFYCKVSFYEFLLKSWQRRTNYIDDMRVAKVVDDGVANHLAIRFPLYCSILTRHIDAANEKNDLREDAASAIAVACPRLQSVRLVVDKILAFLEREDKKCIVKACNVPQIKR